MPRYSLSALGVDRPGIVAAVSGALVDLGCNLEDSTMTILRGHFAILLVVATPPGVVLADVERSLAPVGEAFDLTVAVRELVEEAAEIATGETGAVRSRTGGVPAGDPWTIAVHGADRPGIVHAVTSALAEAGGNVVDLSTHLVGEPESRLYVMTIRATLPGGRDGEDGAAKVQDAASRVGVHCTVHRDEADLL